MKVKQIDLEEERKVLLNCLVDTEFLKKLRPLLRKEYFLSDYARIIIDWIIEYYDKFEKAPKFDIQDIYIRKKGKIVDESVSELISDFLVSLSDDYRINNFDYSLQQAERWLRLQSLRKIKKELEKSIIEGNPEVGEYVIKQFERVGLKKSIGINILKASVEIKNAFIEEKDIIFRFRGALGKLLGNFYRGDLISFFGFSGKGKTWWQLFIAYESMIKGLKVVFFSLEMPMNQILRRFWQMMVGQPIETRIIKTPYFEYDEELEKYVIKHKEKEFKGIDLGEVDRKLEKFKFMFRGGTIIFESLPSVGSTVDDIDIILDNLEMYNNFIPDIIVVDYADIIKPNHRGEYRHQLDSIWKDLKKIAMKRQILVVTATQSTRKGAVKDVSEIDIAEDIRKFNHVSKMIALNQTKKEYEMGLMRIAELKKRNEKRDFRQVVVLQSYDIGRVYLDSRYKDDVVF